MKQGLGMIGNTRQTWFIGFEQSYSRLLGPAILNLNVMFTWSRTGVYGLANPRFQSPFFHLIVPFRSLGITRMAWHNHVLRVPLESTGIGKPWHESQRSIVPVRRERMSEWGVGP